MTIMGQTGIGRVGDVELAVRGSFLRAASCIDRISLMIVSRVAAISWCMAAGS